MMDVTIRRSIMPHLPSATAFAAAALALASLPLTPLVAGNDTAAPPGDLGADVPAPVTKGETQLAKLLEGRVAGEPLRCIRSMPSQRMQTISGTAYVYGRGNRIFVQRTRDPERINDRDALVTNRFSATELCRFDILTTIDPVNGIFTGAVFFEDFVPYTRAAAAPAEG
jgi:hypothetical protein